MKFREHDEKEIEENFKFLKTNEFDKLTIPIRVLKIHYGLLEVRKQQGRGISKFKRDAEREKNENNKPQNHE